MLMRKLVCGAVFALAAASATAGTADSRFTVSADGRNVDFDVRSVSRREVLSRLFRGISVEFKWLNAAAGNQLVSGTFSGSPGKVVSRILSPTDFVVVYERTGTSPRISRIVVLGPSSGQSGGATRPAIEAALPAILHAPVATAAPAGTVADVDPVIMPAPMNAELPLKPAVGADAMALITPPPPGVHPPLILPPPGMVAPPLTPAPDGEPPPLRPEPR